ncbi:MAG: hypothetical protein ACP5KI_02070 [Brevinematia bacterium]
MKLKRFLYCISLIMISAKSFSYYNISEYYMNYSNSIYISIKYENESFENKIFFKPNENNMIGIESKILFNIPLYTYSGYIENTITSGNFRISYTFLKLKLFQDFKLAINSFLEYEYLLDYNRFSIGFGVFGEANLLNNLKYVMELKNINFGIYKTEYTSLKSTFTPFVIENKLIYKLKYLNFYAGLVNQLDIEYIKALNSIYLGIEYKTLENLSLGIKNTFRIGNSLDLEISSKIPINKLLFILSLGFNYITGIKSEIELMFNL